MRKTALYVAGALLTVVAGGFGIYKALEVQQPARIARPARPSLPANDLYTQNLDAREKQGYVDWLHNGARTEFSLDDFIKDNSYVHFRSNAGSLKEAELLLFGDVHGLYGDEFRKVVLMANAEGLIKPDTKFLIEGTEEKVDLAALVARNETDGLASLADSLRLFHYFTVQDAGEQHFQNVLASAGKGRLIGVDAPKEILYQHLFYIVQNYVLNNIESKLQENKPLHPFEQWMVTHDLKFGTHELQEKIKDYRAKMPSESTVYRARDDIIARRVVEEVISSSPPAFMFFGSGHIEGKSGVNATESGFSIILSALENAGVKYIAFIPNTKDASSPNAENSQAYRLNSERYTRRIMDSYAELRGNDTPFTGSLDDYFN